MSWPTIHNIINLVHEKDWSCSITWIDWNQICFSTWGWKSWKIWIDILCLISALSRQNPTLFSKFANQWSETTQQ